MKRLTLLAAVSAVFLMGASDDPSDQLKDPALESRARHLFQEVRCVVCQNESIAGSNADLAHDLRMLVRQQIAAGKTDKEIRNYLFERYGDFILLRPRVEWKTGVLWGAPFVVVLVGVGLIFAGRRRTSSALEDDLTPEEDAALRKLQRQMEKSG